MSYELSVASTMGSCLRPVTDGAGRWIGLGTGGAHSLAYVFVPASGQGQPSGSMAVTWHGTTPFPIAPQPSGYHAATGGDLGGPLRVYDERGDVVSEGGTVGVPHFLVGDPTGGSAIDSWDALDRLGPEHLELVDAAGRLRASLIVDRALDGLAVTRSGNVLALSGTDGRWFDRDAKALTGWFSIGASGSPALLADGSIGIHDGGRWLAVVPDGRGEAAPPPSWLAARPVHVEVVRGGRANAFVPPITVACTPSIELVTPSGKSCGTVHPAAGGDPCVSVEIGKDGTVFATSAIVPPRGSGFRCVFRWWSGLLR